MGANFGRLKNWVKERLKFADLNAEFNNILNGMTPDGVDDYSLTVNQMRIATNPAPYTSGSQVEALPTSLAGELAGIRYILRRLGGGTYWYTDSARTLEAQSGDLANLLAFDGNTANDVLADFIYRGGIINALSLSTADVASGDFDSTNKKFGGFSYDLGAGNILALPGKIFRTGLISGHFRNLSAGDYIAYNPLLGIECFLNGSGYLVARVTRKTCAVEGAKDIASVTGTVSRAGSTDWQHVALRYVIDNANGASADSLELKRNGLDENTGVGSADLLANLGDGGIWFFGAKKNNPAWDKLSAMKDTPDAEGSDAWSAVLGGGGAAVSNGILTIAAGGGAEAVYSKTNNIDLSHMTMEVKAKVNAAGSQATIIEAYDHSMTRKVNVTLLHDRVTITGGIGLGGTVFLNGFDFNVFRVTTSGSPDPTLKFYVNGQLMLTFVMNVATTLVSDYIKFGPVISSEADYELVAYAGVPVTVAPPVAVSSSGQLDDIALVKIAASDNIITQLMNNPAKSVYGADPRYGITLPRGSNFSAKNYTSSIEVVGSALFFPSDGRTPIDHFATYRFDASAGGTFISYSLDSSGESVGGALLSATSYSAQPLPFIGRRVHKLGLRKLYLSVLVPAGTLTMGEGEVMLAGGK